MPRRSRRRERAELAESLRSAGQSWTEIASAFRARWPELTPLAALRLSHGWTQQQAAEVWNARWPDRPKAGKDIGLWENWGSGAGRRPSLPSLDRLAQLYRCSVADLLPDHYDHRHLDDDGGDPWARVAVRPDGPARPVGPADIDLLRTLTAAIAAVDNVSGGGAVAASGIEQLRWATGLLAAPGDQSQSAALHEALGNLASVVGFVLLDVAEPSQAERCFRFGLRCAEQARSASLRVCVLADLARVRADTGDVAGALSTIEGALVDQRSVPATGRAMLLVMHGRYLAMSGQARESQRAVGAADEAMVDRRPDDDPPWLRYYDQAEHDGSVARTLLMAGDRSAIRSVQDRLRAAISQQDERYVRSRVFSSLRLARVQLVDGAPDRALCTAVAVLDDAAQLRSERASAEWSRLAAATGPYRRDRDGAALYELVRDRARGTATQS